MKRALLITVFLIVAFAAAGSLVWPHVVRVLSERNAARNRQANHLPDDALHALTSDTGLTLYSIDPYRGAVDSPTVPTFQRWVVLGQTTVAAAEQRQDLADTLQQGLSRWSGRELVGCFNPRHAIRATDGMQTFDFLICFECGWLYYYPPNSKARHLNIRTKAGPFNDILVSADIQMPEQPQQQ